MLRRMPCVPSVAMKEGIFSLDTIRPLSAPETRPMRRTAGKAQGPSGPRRSMNTTETRDIIDPTERSMPPVRMTQACPNPTARRIPTALRMVCAL